MLQLPNLDDQTYADIMEAALARLPQLQSEWTDHNAHDPGITMLELFAWYKQYQQYHLNKLGEAELLAFLKLLGVRPEPVRPAQGMAVPLGQEPLWLYPGLCAHSSGGERFELTGEAAQSKARIHALYLERAKTRYDIFAALQEGAMPVVLRQENILHIGLTGTMPPAGEPLCLWVALREDYPAQRNPFPEAGGYRPRTLRVFFPGMEDREATILRDDTHTLACAGALHIAVPDGFSKSCLEEGQEPRYWVSIALLEEGCEEPAELEAVFLSPFAFAQTHTYSEVHERTCADGVPAPVTLCSRLAMEGEIRVFVRDEYGWYPLEEQSYSVEKAAQQEGQGAHCSVTLPALCPAQDGAMNLRIVCTEQAYFPHTRREASGLPGQRLLLHSGAGVPAFAPGGIRVMCREYLENGRARYVDWSLTGALNSHDGKSRVFAYDEAEDALCFGDNRNGRMPRRGKDAILVLGLVKTMAGEGVLPQGDVLHLGEATAGSREAQALIVHAQKGVHRETAAMAAARFKAAQKIPARAVTEEDYAYLAMATPGLRVWAAKALPLYQKDENIVGRTEAMVSVVVLPYALTERPLPNARFLEAVQAQLEQYRPVCTQVEAIAPLYAPLTIVAEVSAAGAAPAVEESVEEVLCAYFAPAHYMVHRLGLPLTQSALMAQLARAGSVLAVQSVHIAAVQGVQYTRTRRGDIQLPKHAIPYLNKLELRISD